MCYVIKSSDLVQCDQVTMRTYLTQATNKRPKIFSMGNKLFFVKEFRSLCSQHSNAFIIMNERTEPLFGRI